MRSKAKPGLRRSYRHCNNWAGNSAATCRSIHAGVQAIPSCFVNTPRNWSHRTPTLSWALPTLSSLISSRSAALCRSYSSRQIDPVGSGFVASLARPGGNATGFTNFEFSFNAKLLDLLKEMSPNTTRVAVVRDPLVQAGSGGFAAIQTAASSLGTELVPIGVRDADEIEYGIAEFARRPNGGLIVVGPPSSIISSNRSLIVRLAVQHHLPAIYASLGFVSFGGLISYGSDQITDYRRAASYVDRILKGEKPADLPVQAPTKYNLIINLKAAK